MELTTIVGNLLGAIDADNIEVKALELAGMESGEAGEEFRRTAREQLVGKATAVFTGGLIELIDRIRRDKEQTIDHDTLDKLLRAEWDKAMLRPWWTNLPPILRSSRTGLKP